MNIIFITSNYPYESRPYHGAFVQELVRAFARLGIKCTVIRPLSIFNRRFDKLDNVFIQDTTVNENPIQIWSPRYISASARNLGFLNTYSITQYNYYKIVTKTISKLKVKPDVLYGHFLYPSGAVAVRLALKMNIPSIVAVGDDTIFDHFNSVSLAKSQHDFSNVCGVIAVSMKNKVDYMKTYGFPENKICMHPNGLDLSVFYPRNRAEMRRKFNFPCNKFIIAFTGHFIERKGPDRLISAVSGVEQIGLVFIGEGNIPINGKNTLFTGVLEHSKVPEMLSAADIFVLPTLMEGSCNAIIEAIACGLPIVTSKGKFNDDIVHNSFTIRIDPLNIDEIRNAIVKLKNDTPLRQKMSKQALVNSKKYDINIRAKKILEFIQETKTNYSNNMIN